MAHNSLSRVLSSAARKGYSVQIGRNMIAGGQPHGIRISKGGQTIALFSSGPALARTIRETIRKVRREGFPSARPVDISSGEAVYNALQKGEKIGDISAATGAPPSTLRGRASRYARGRGLPWPVSTSTGGK